MEESTKQNERSRAASGPVMVVGLTALFGVSLRGCAAASFVDWEEGIPEGASLIGPEFWFCVLFPAVMLSGAMYVFRTKSRPIGCFVACGTFFVATFGFMVYINCLSWGDDDAPIHPLLVGPVLAGTYCTLQWLVAAWWGTSQD